MYHPRIVHLCNVLEVAPSKWLISKALISLFFSFWSWLHNSWDEMGSVGITVVDYDLVRLALLGLPKSWHSY